MYTYNMCYLVDGWSSADYRVLVRSIPLLHSVDVHVNILHTHCQSDKRTTHCQ